MVWSSKFRSVALLDWPRIEAYFPLGAEVLTVGMLAGLTGSMGRLGGLTGRAGGVTPAGSRAITEPKRAMIAIKKTEDTILVNCILIFCCFDKTERICWKITK